MHGRNVGALEAAADLGAVLESAPQFLAHIVGRLVRKRDGEDAQRIGTAGYQTLEILDEHAGLARAGTGNDTGIRRGLLDCDGFQLTSGQSHAGASSARMAAVSKRQTSRRSQ